MTVTLLNHTPLWIADKAIGKCWDKPTPDTNDEGVCPSCGSESFEFKSQPDDYYLCDNCNAQFGSPIKIPGCNVARIERIANKNKHASTIEHVSYNFDIDGISRACLQELVRHRISSFSVKSSRYTLAELTDEDTFITPFTEQYAIDRACKYIVLTGNDDVDSASVEALENLRSILNNNCSNDLAKYCMPEAYRTSLVWTINARSLQNFLSLRSSKAALWEIRDLAQAIFDALPDDHKFLFEDCVAES